MAFLINLIKEESSPHTHKNYEIIVYTRGRGIFHATEKDVLVSPGKIIIIPPGTVHSVTFDGRLERIYINGDLNHIFNLAAPTVILDTPEKEGLFLAKMIYANRYTNSEYTAALIGAFAHFLLQSLKMEDAIHLVIKDIVNKITNNFYDSTISLSSLLQKSGYAEDYIRTQFKKSTGKTPTEFLTEIRIRHACYLIDTYKSTLSLSEIAEKCGYTDYVYFSRRFKHILGMSPRKYMSP
ncbi:MAG: helix-turn-helix domain-containing protein [Ruminococcaceae bacterium]|nr:helix-turn-helix domain-containing protein [Oscillospiraceae bacterium]